MGENMTSFVDVIKSETEEKPEITAIKKTKKADIKDKFEILLTHFSVWTLNILFHSV